jgi:iron complex outermembrane receptor protein
VNLKQQRAQVCTSAVSLALASMAAPAAFGQDTQVVVVTAQSRSQQIQNVPISVQTMSGAALKDQGAASWLTSTRLCPASPSIRHNRPALPCSCAA